MIVSTTTLLPGLYETVSWFWRFCSSSGSSSFGGSGCSSSFGGSGSGSGRNRRFGSGTSRCFTTNYTTPLIIFYTPITTFI